MKHYSLLAFNLIRSNVWLRLAILVIALAVATWFWGLTPAGRQHITQVAAFYAGVAVGLLAPPLVIGGAVWWLTFKPRLALGVGLCVLAVVSVLVYSGRTILVAEEEQKLLRAVGGDTTAPGQFKDPYAGTTAPGQFKDPFARLSQPEEPFAGLVHVGPKRWGGVEGPVEPQRR